MRATQISWDVTRVLFAVLAIILVPVAIAVATLIDRADEIAGWTKSLAHVSVPPPPAWIVSLPVVGAKLAARWQEVAAMQPSDLAAHITPHLAVIGGWLLAQAGGLLALLVQLLLTLALAALLYAQGEAAAEWVIAFARRLAGGQGERAVRLSGQAIRAIALGIVVTALVQSIVGGIGLVIAGVPHATILTAVMFLLGVP